MYLSLVALLLSGCVTKKKYRLAKDNTPPAKVLGWTTTTPDAELTLATLIIFKGPGSWKRDARWDEYVMQITNRGDQSMVLYSAELIDLMGSPQSPGVDPWTLEKLSYTNWDKYGSTGLQLAAGAGAVVLYTGAATAVAIGSALSGGAVAGGAGLAALNIIPIVAIVDIAAVAVINSKNKGKVQEEFLRRRLDLPLTLSPGATIAGSLFFPMTPGPQRLVIKGTAGDSPVEIGLDLKPLADLHIDRTKKK